MWSDPAKPRPRPEDPSLVVTTLCELCGASSTSDLSGYPEDQRQIVRLYSTSKLEDTFTDPRAWAAQEWSVYRSAAKRQARKALREMRRLSESAESAYGRQQRDYARQQQKRERERAREKDPDVKLYNGLLAEVQSLYKRWLKRLGRRYGEHPFSELEARLGLVEGPDYDRLYKGEPYERDIPFSLLSEIREEARLWQACAELEKVVLGDVTETTAGLLADCERRAREAVAAARAKHEGRKFPRLERPAGLAPNDDAALPESH
jgi:hypothetical protein